MLYCHSYNSVGLEIMNCITSFKYIYLISTKRSTTFNGWYIKLNVHVYILQDIYIYTYIYMQQLYIYICVIIYMYTHIMTCIFIYIYIYGKCLGFARTRNDDGQRIIIIIIIIININIMINIIIIITINKPFLKIFNECRSLKKVGELNPPWRSSMNVEV